LGINRDDIRIYIGDVKRAVSAGRYTISAREKNERLFDEFIFTEQKREDILLELCVEDFCEVLDNDNPLYPNEKLYVFGKDVRLLPKYGGDERNVSLYIKFNKLENLYCIVVSFHEQEHPLSYAFK